MELREELEQEYKACKSILNIREKNEDVLFADSNENPRIEMITRSLKEVVEDEELLEALGKTYSFGPVLAEFTIHKFQKRGIVQVRLWLNWKELDEKTKKELNKYGSSDIYDFLHEYYENFICRDTSPLHDDDYLEWLMCKQGKLHWGLHEMVTAFQDEEVCAALSKMFENFVKKQLVLLLKLQEKTEKVLSNLR